MPVKTDATRELVMKYFHSWQKPPNFDEMADCFSADAEIDLGVTTLRGGKAFKDAVGRGESTWLGVKLLESVFSGNEAALFYEGMEEATGVRHRVAEHLTVEGGKIARMRAAICKIGRRAEAPGVKAEDERQADKEARGGNGKCS